MFGVDVADWCVRGRCVFDVVEAFVLAVFWNAASGAPPGAKRLDLDV